MKGQRDGSAADDDADRPAVLLDLYPPNYTFNVAQLVRACVRARVYGRSVCSWCVCVVRGAQLCVGGVQARLEGGRKGREGTRV